MARDVDARRTRADSERGGLAYCYAARQRLSIFIAFTDSIGAVTVGITVIAAAATAAAIATAIVDVSVATSGPVTARLPMRSIDARPAITAAFMHRCARKRAFLHSNFGAASLARHHAGATHSPPAQNLVGSQAANNGRPRLACRSWCRAQLL